MYNLADPARGQCPPATPTATRSCWGTPGSPTRRSTRAANQVANLLVSRGIEPGDKVALSCPNLPYFTIVYYGILKAGATVVPLNVLLKGREVAYHLDDSDAKAYFCFEGTAELPMAKEGHAGLRADRRLRALLRDHRRPGGALADRGHRDDRRGDRPAAADVRDRGDRRGRHRGHPLHLRHHRPAQGRRAAAPQHARQRAGRARSSSAPTPTTPTPTCACCRSSTPSARP